MRPKLLALSALRLTFSERVNYSQRPLSWLKTRLMFIKISDRMIGK